MRLQHQWFFHRRKKNKRYPCAALFFMKKKQELLVVSKEIRIFSCKKLMEFSRLVFPWWFFNILGCIWRRFKSDQCLRMFQWQKLVPSKHSNLDKIISYKWRKKVSMKKNWIFHPPPKSNVNDFVFIEIKYLNINFVGKGIILVLF